MPTDRSFGEFAARLDRFDRSFDGPGLRKLLTSIGEAGQREATAAASADLGGDPKFSGWAPTLDTKYRITGATMVQFQPSRRSAGPWTVAEFGRHSQAGPRMAGPRLTKTGRVSRARVRRWNGRTEGKQTATKAIARIEGRVGGLCEKHVKQSIRKAFG